MIIRLYALGLVFILMMLSGSGISPGYGQQTNQTRTNYYFSGINYFLPDYPKTLHRRVAILERSPGVTRIPVSLDVIGYYRPSGTKLIGGMLKWSSDYYTAYETSFQIEYYQAAWSVLYYFIRPEKRENLFIRGDLGPVCLRLSSSDKGTEKLNFGWGVLIGFGYAFRIGNISLMSEYHYSHLFIKNNIHRQNSVGFGVLY